MKVSPLDLNTIKDAIEPFDTPERREKYRTGNFPRADKVKDLNKRYRWDLYWLASHANGGLPDSRQGYNMDHLNTALKSLVKEL